MACATSDQITDIQGDLAASIAYIAWLDASINSGTVSAGTKRYDFDSGTGRQSEVFNSPIELIRARKIEMATRDRLRRSLNGTSIMTTRLRR